MRPNAHSTLAGLVVEGLGSSLKRPILAESFLEDLGSSLGGVTLAGPPVGLGSSLKGLILAGPSLEGRGSSLRGVIPAGPSGSFLEGWGSSVRGVILPGPSVEGFRQHFKRQTKAFESTQAHDASNVFAPTPGLFYPTLPLF